MNEGPGLRSLAEFTGRQNQRPPALEIGRDVEEEGLRRGAETHQLVDLKIAVVLIDDDYLQPGESLNFTNV